MVSEEKNVLTTNDDICILLLQEPSFVVRTMQLSLGRSGEMLHLSLLAGTVIHV